MKMRQVLRMVIIVAILGSNIGCDQISKSIVRQRIAYYEEVKLINPYFTLTKIENTGAFLSLGDSLPRPLKMVLLTILPVLVLAGALVYLLTKKTLSRMTVLGICFVVGGGAGNIYDRLVYGSVTDFLHIDFVIFQTGIFNLADVSIMAGIFIILIESYLTRTKLTYETPD